MGKQELLAELGKVLEEWQLEQLMENLEMVKRRGHGDVRLEIAFGEVKFVGAYLSWDRSAVITRDKLSE
jgi:hypothetical protein